MVAFSCRVRFLLAFILWSATQASFLQRERRQQAGGDWDDSEVKLCTFGAKASHENPIKIFADESDNTRYVSFAREGFATDDGFIESMQKCKGAMPEICKLKNKNTSSTPRDCADCPCELDLDHSPYGNYQRRMLEVVTSQCQSSSGNRDRGKDPFRVLLVGLGGGALVQYVLGQCPQGTMVEAAEYDPRMIEIATRFFGLRRPSPNGVDGVFKIEQGDGGAIIAAHATQGHIYDMVLVDAFAGGSHVPESCRDAAFISNLQRILRKGGTVLHNMAGPTFGNLAGPDDYKVALPLYKKSFGSKYVNLEELTGNLEFPSRLIVAQVPS